MRSSLQRAMEMPGIVTQFKKERDEGLWMVSGRTPDALLDAALAELRTGSGSAARLELAVYGIWWLTLCDALLRAGRGRHSTDGREPSALLRWLMSNEHGLRILHRAVVDGRAGKDTIAVVNAAGEVERSTTGSIQFLTDSRLRAIITLDHEDAELSSEVAEVADRVQNVQIPVEQYRAAQRRVTSLATQLEAEMTVLTEILDEQGVALSTRYGFDGELADEVRGRLDKVRDEIIYQRRIWEQARAAHQARTEAP
jgi:hypothetical protein